MTSFQQNSNEHFFKPLLKTQLKASMNYLVIGILLIILMSLVSYTLDSMSSGSDRFEIAYIVINPLYMLFILCIWGLNFGVHLSQNDVNKSLFAFVGNSRLLVWMKQIVFLIYAAIIALVILGAIYMMYLISYVSDEPMINFLTVSNSAISFMIMLLLLFTSMNLGYLFAQIKTNRMAQLLLSLFLVAIICVNIFIKNDVFLYMIGCSLVFALLCLLFSYKGMMKEGGA